MKKIHLKNGSKVSSTKNYKLEFSYNISEDLETIFVCITAYNKAGIMIIDDDGEFGFKDNNKFFYGYVHANFEKEIADVLENNMKDLEKDFGVKSKEEEEI